MSKRKEASTKTSLWQHLAKTLGVNVAIATGNGTHVSVNNKGPVTQGDNQPIKI